MTKKLLVAFLVVLLAFCLVLIFTVPSAPTVTGPRPIYEPLPPAFTITNLSYVSYDFLNPNPFSGGVMRMTAGEKPGAYVAYLYDIEKRRCLGKLNTAWV